MTFEELKKEFIDHGFTIDGDVFAFDKIEYVNVNINGRVQPQERHKVFKMKYVCEGSICDAGDSDCDVLYEFDVLGGRDEPMLTILIENFDDFTKLV